LKRLEALDMHPGATPGWTRDPDWTVRVLMRR
jgi:hypothetical protein